MEIKKQKKNVVYLNVLFGSSIAWSNRAIRAVTSSGGAAVETFIRPPFFSVLTIQLSYFSQHRNH